MCRKDRLIELMHDFVLFDGGVKKLPRAHQYFGIKAAQEYVREKKGGIIWHTQGEWQTFLPLPALYPQRLFSRIADPGRRDLTRSPLCAGRGLAESEAPAPSRKLPATANPSD